MSIFKRHYNRENINYGINSLRKGKILSLVGKAGSRKILDIGCATGLLGKEMKSRGNEVYGIDISESAVKEAKKHLDDAFVLDIQEEDLPFKDGYFDIVILSEVIEHLMFPEEVMQKIKRVLNKDGAVVITTPNFLVFSNRARIFLGRFEYADEGILVPEHIHFFCHASLKKFLRKNGFTVAQEDNLTHPKIPEFIGKIFPNLFAFQIIVAAKLSKNNEI